MRVENGFQPTPFTEGNAFTDDPVLPALVKRLFPKSIAGEIAADLTRLGDDIPTKIRPLGDRVAPPQLTQYDQWGRRVDRLETSEGWRALTRVLQSEGIPGIFYERTYGEYSRIYGFMKVLMLIGDSHEVFCPLSMTDGAARIIELLGTPSMKEQILPRLISRDPSFAVTSGQWMTERPGGSDVSQTETVARPTGRDTPLGPEYTLDGFKWFSSATDSAMSVALARTGSTHDGSRGLSLFLVPLRRPLFDPTATSTSNNIFVHRLKQKIGTHALPTAELALEGATAFRLGALHRGVKSIAPVLNITRVYSAVSSAGALRKALGIATAYARVRAVGGGRLLADAPLHVARLAEIALVYRGVAHLALGAVALLGRVECGAATRGEAARLRVLTPVAKAFAAETACGAMEGAMAALGGAGYMEENGLGRLIRDALVEKIWEGTTTVLALDLVRAVQDAEALQAFTTWGLSVLASCPASLGLAAPIALLRTALDSVPGLYAAPLPPLVAHPALLVVGNVAAGLFLLEHAVWAHVHGEESMAGDAEVVRRWVEEGGLAAAAAAAQRARVAGGGRVAADAAMVFGERARAGAGTWASGDAAVAFGAKL